MESLSIGHAGRHVSKGMNSSPLLRSIEDPSSDGHIGIQSVPGIKSSAPRRLIVELLSEGQAGKQVSKGK